MHAPQARCGKSKGKGMTDSSEPKFTARAYYPSNKWDEYDAIPYDQPEPEPVNEHAHLLLVERPFQTIEHNGKRYSRTAAMSGFVSTLQINGITFSSMKDVDLIAWEKAHVAHMQREREAIDSRTAEEISLERDRVLVQRAVAERRDRIGRPNGGAVMCSGIEKSVGPGANDDGAESWRYLSGKPEPTGVAVAHVANEVDAFGRPLEKRR
jgi:hypothetical protein